MGAADAEDDERPVHRVYVSEFFIGRLRRSPTTSTRTSSARPATRRRRSDDLPLVASGRTRRSCSASWRRRTSGTDATPPAGRGSHPVVLVRYEDALAYCRWLSDTLGRVVRLPTEAEWEKAARGGVEAAAVPVGQRHRSVARNFLAGRDLRSVSAARGQPERIHRTRYGLYDMIGNVWEWVSDWYAATTTGSARRAIRAARPPARMRIVRGGSWVNDDASMLRCAYRHKVPPDTYAYSMGFRIVCRPDRSLVLALAVRPRLRQPQPAGAGHRDQPAKPSSADARSRVRHRSPSRRARRHRATRSARMRMR